MKEGVNKLIDTVLPDVIEKGLDVFINEDHQDQTGEGSSHRQLRLLAIRRTNECREKFVFCKFSSSVFKNY